MGHESVADLYFAQYDLRARKNQRIDVCVEKRESRSWQSRRSSIASPELGHRKQSISREAPEEERVLTLCFCVCRVSGCRSSEAGTGKTGRGACIKECA